MGRKAKALGVSPSFAGNKANVISLAVRVDPPGLPPLLITGVNYMQHIPKAETQGLAQEAAVLGLVVVKQGPGGQVAIGQSLAEDSSYLKNQPRGLGPEVYSKAQLLMALAQVLWILRNPRTVWGQKAIHLLVISTPLSFGQHCISDQTGMDSVQFLKIQNTILQRKQSAMSMHITVTGVTWNLLKFVRKQKSLFADSHYPYQYRILINKPQFLGSEEEEG